MVLQSRRTHFREKKSMFVIVFMAILALIIFAGLQDVDGPGGSFAYRLPRVTVSVSDAVAREPGGAYGTIGTNTATFAISRSGSTSAPLTVYYALSGTATTIPPDNDYVPLSGSATIPAGSSSATVVIRPIEDYLQFSTSQVNQIEATETVVLTIISHPSYMIVSPSQETISIDENDAIPAGITPPRNIRLSNSYSAAICWTEITWDDLSAGEDRFEIWRRDLDISFPPYDRFKLQTFVGQNVNVWTDPSLHGGLNRLGYRIVAKNPSNQRTSSEDIRLDFQCNVPSQYLKCVNNACTSVNGYGANQCSTGVPCTPGPTHLACVNNVCLQSPGPGPGPGPSACPYAGASC